MNPYLDSPSDTSKTVGQMGPFSRGQMETLGRCSPSCGGSYLAMREAASSSDQTGPLWLVFKGKPTRKPQRKTPQNPRDNLRKTSKENPSKTRGKPTKQKNNTRETDGFSASALPFLANSGTFGAPSAWPRSPRAQCPAPCPPPGGSAKLRALCWPQQLGG